MNTDFISEIQFNEQGLVPAVLQDYHTRAVLMMAWMNEEALKLTLETKKATFYSRSRKQLWVKGETSGHYQHVVAMDYDCDGDTLLLQVIPDGPACHTGHTSCFYRNAWTDHEMATGNSDILSELSAQIIDRKNHPVSGSYTNYLLNEGIDKVLKKVGEESAETIIAAKNKDNDELAGEVADLLYHLSVLLTMKDFSFDDVFAVLDARHHKKRRDEYNDQGKIKD